MWCVYILFFILYIFSIYRYREKEEKREAENWVSERIERILHGSQVSQPSWSLQGNFGLDEQYVELFIFPPGHQQAFDGCLNSILQQQQQHL